MGDNNFVSSFNPIKGSNTVTKTKRPVKTRSLQLSENSLSWPKKPLDKSLKIGQNPTTFSDLVQSRLKQSEM